VAAQRLVTSFKYLNDCRELAISFFAEVLLASLLFLCSLSIIVASFEFYNLFNIARDPLNPPLNSPLFKILLSSKPSLLYSCTRGK